jgi:hypothetical protein
MGRISRIMKQVFIHDLLNVQGFPRQGFVPRKFNSKQFIPSFNRDVQDIQDKETGVFSWLAERARLSKV